MALPSWLTPPLLARLDALSLSIRAVRAGAHLGGRFAVNRRGSSVEFAEHAPYHPGDDIRAIDWNLYARLDKLFIKTYREEIELSVEVIVCRPPPSVGPPGRRGGRAYGYFCSFQNNWSLISSAGLSAFPS